MSKRRILPAITDEDIVGEVMNVWFEPADGWYWCDGIITDKYAQNLIKNGWSVSCSYSYTKSAKGGTENNIPYDIEFLDGEFEHLAIVEKPRYERANIVFNAKYNPEQKRDKYGKWVRDIAVIQQKKDNLKPIEIDPNKIPQFKTKKDLGEWFKGIFKEIGNVTIDDTGIIIDLYASNAEREAFKRRFQQEPNKAVAKAFDEVVSKAIKTDERLKDEHHKHNQEIYYNKLKLGEDVYDVNLFVDYLEPNNEYRYAGHNTEKIDNEMTARDMQVINHIMLTKAVNIIIPDFEENKTLDVKKHEDNVNNEKWVTKFDKEGEPYHFDIDAKDDDKKDKKTEPQKYSKDYNSEYEQRKQNKLVYIGTPELYTHSYKDRFGQKWWQVSLYGRDVKINGYEDKTSSRKFAAQAAESSYLKHLKKRLDENPEYKAAWLAEAELLDKVQKEEDGNKIRELQEERGKTKLEEIEKQILKKEYKNDFKVLETNEKYTIGTNGDFYAIWHTKDYTPFEEQTPGKSSRDMFESFYNESGLNDDKEEEPYDKTEEIYKEKFGSLDWNKIPKKYSDIVNNAIAKALTDKALK